MSPVHAVLTLRVAVYLDICGEGLPRGLVTLEAELHVSKLEREEALRLAARKAEIQAKREALGRAYVRIGQRHNKLELFRLQTANVRKTNCTQAELERVHDGTHPGSLEKPPQEGKRSQTLRPAPAACTNRNTIPTGSSIICGYVPRYICVTSIYLAVIL